VRTAIDHGASIWPRRPFYRYGIMPTSPGPGGRLVKVIPIQRVMPGGFFGEFIEEIVPGARQKYVTQ